jgi:hypothetical protein
MFNKLHTIWHSLFETNAKYKNKFQYIFRTSSAGEVRKGWEILVLRNSMIFTFHQVLLGWSDQDRWDGWETYNKRVKMRNVYTVLHKDIRAWTGVGDQCRALVNMLMDFRVALEANFFTSWATTNFNRPSYRVSELYFKYITELLHMRCKVVPVLIQLSITPSRRIGEWRYSSAILDLKTRWRCQLYASAALPPGKGLLHKRLGGPQGRFWRCGVGKNFAAAGNPTLAVATPSELPQLLI